MRIDKLEENAEVEEGPTRDLSEDLHSERQKIIPIIQYLNPCPLCGRFPCRGHCHGQLIRELILRGGALNVINPEEGSDSRWGIIEEFNWPGGTGLCDWDKDLRDSPDLTLKDLPERWSLVQIRPRYRNIVRYDHQSEYLSHVRRYEQDPNDGTESPKIARP